MRKCAEAERERERERGERGAERQKAEVRTQQAERLHTFSAAHAGAYKSTNYLLSINLKPPLERDSAQRGPEFRTLSSEMDFSCSAWCAHNVNQKFRRFVLPVSPSLFGILRGTVLRSFKNSGNYVGYRWDAADTADS
jgi:hypothetical protein